MRRGRQRKLAAGLLLPWTRPPYGYRVDPEQPRNPAGVRPEESEAAVVAFLFTRYTEGGVSLCGIAQQLQQNGVLTPQGKPHWGGSTVRQILCNPVYTGQLYANRYRTTPAQGRCSALRPIGHRSYRETVQPRQEWLAIGTVPAIIREEQYKSAQNRMALNQSFRLAATKPKLICSAP